MKPHIYAEVIKAYADGATVQFKDFVGDWQDILNPSFLDSYEYRIKPEPNPDYAKYIAFDMNNCTSNLKNSKPLLDDWDCVIQITIDGETHKIKITIDGETNKPKSVELI